MSGRMVIFFREGFFYPVWFTPKCDVLDHVRLNPGTTRVEELDGTVIWPAPQQTATVH